MFLTGSSSELLSVSSDSELSLDSCFFLVTGAAPFLAPVAAGFFTGMDALASSSYNSRRASRKQIMNAKILTMRIID